MEAFATVGDLESRWRVMDPSEKARASVLLMDAAAIISAALEQSGVKIAEDNETQAANLVRVSCAMVQRAMAQGDGEQEHAWGGNLVLNPSGDLYLSKADKRSLGIGRMRIGFASPFGGAE
jgi:hypothetical protein